MTRRESQENREKSNDFFEFLCRHDVLRQNALGEWSIIRKSVPDAWAYTVKKEEFYDTRSKIRIRHTPRGDG